MPGDPTRRSVSDCRILSLPIGKRAQAWPIGELSFYARPLNN